MKYAVRGFKAEYHDSGVTLEYRIEDENGVSGTLIHNLDFTEAINLGSVLKQWGMLLKQRGMERSQ